MVHKPSTQGFTLVELIVVIAIIAILSSVSVIGMQRFIQTAKDSRAQTELTLVQKKVNASFVLSPIEFTIPSEGVEDGNYVPGTLKADIDFSFRSQTFAVLFLVEWIASESGNPAHWGSPLDYDEAVARSVVYAINQALTRGERVAVTSRSTRDPELVVSQTYGYWSAIYYQDSGTAEWESFSIITS